MNTVSQPLVIGRPSLLRIYLSEAAAELLRLLRTPSFSVPTLAFPLVFYVLFGIVPQGHWGDLHKATYLLATYGVFGVIGPALFGFGVGLAIERQQGWLELKRVSPMPTGAYFFAKIAMSLVFALAVILELSVAAIGYADTHIAIGTWLLWVAALLLGTLPFCALGLWIGTLVKGQAAVAVVNLVYLPMSVLSGLWMPLAAFPTALQKLAVVWPAWHLSRIALGVIGQIREVHYLSHVGVLLAMTALFLSLAALRLRSV
ncbi:ABC transporter permease [Methylococcus sp. EFPC2]|uniref:ABC transporter permease n=1 Tax=Methylococcus sp. EFPC2 TaxID=2812648 RepID=UPI001966E906|nr:ABC transporter permease [Methylococcus sp. EFPC2]QSA97255.1 ABC transporter permease [Methylococcus sp. EFPC2]